MTTPQDGEAGVLTALRDWALGGEDGLQWPQPHGTLYVDGFHDARQALLDHLDDLIAAARYAALVSPDDGLEEERRDPRVDWDAIETLVDAAVRREDISVGRAAEMLGVRLQTWRDRARELAPVRDMLDGSPCWCVSEHKPHEGWVHSPNCEFRRRLARQQESSDER